jgi:uncharacterized membrane protein (DUF4010 family)
MENGVLAQLGIAAGLGLLVGLQRERAGSRFGGIRTFPIITILGAIAALLSKEFSTGWIIGAGFIALALLATASNYLAAGDESRDPGMTTEVTALAMYALGAYSVFGPPPIVMAVGVCIAVLLYAKEGLHGFTDRLGEKDMRAIMLFAAITFIILPVLPDKTYGPFDVFNPRNTWLMVVLVVGISLGGYIAWKVLGARGGAVLSGILGGLISSTATTATYARRAAGKPDAVRPSLLVIVIAGTIVYARVFTEIVVVSQSFAQHAAAPLAIMFAVSAAIATFIWFATRGDAGKLAEPENPTQLKSALLFAALYVLVTFVIAAGERYFQNRGLYVAAAVFGLTDMDAMTLSTSRMVNEGSVAPGAGWRAVLIAAIANIVFKTGIVASLGGRRLFLMAAATGAVQIATAIALIALWPTRQGEAEPSAPDSAPVGVGWSEDSTGAGSGSSGSGGALGSLSTKSNPRPAGILNASKLDLPTAPLLSA